MNVVGILNAPLFAVRVKRLRGVTVKSSSMSLVTEAPVYLRRLAKPWDLICLRISCTDPALLSRCAVIDEPLFGFPERDAISRKHTGRSRLSHVTRYRECSYGNTRDISTRDYTRADGEEERSQMRSREY